MADFDTVAPGQPVRNYASERNILCEMAREFLGRRGRMAAERLAEQGFRPAIISCKNLAEAEVPRFGVLGIDGPRFGPEDNADEFQSNPLLKGVTPVVDHDDPTILDHVGRFVVTLELSVTDRIVRACHSGVTIARLLVNEEEDRYADVGDEETGYLVTQVRGAAEILWKEEGTGEKWAIVRLGAMRAPKLIGKAASGIPALTPGSGGNPDEPGRGDVTVYRFNAARKLVPTAHVVKAYNLSLEAAGANKWLQLAWQEQDIWLVDYEDCGE